MYLTFSLTGLSSTAIALAGLDSGSSVTSTVKKGGKDLNTGTQSRKEIENIRH